jgi:hypothetical protein
MDILMPTPIYEQRDKETKKLTGKKFIYFKLIAGRGAYNTAFTTPTGKVVDWKRLMGKYVKIIPLFGCRTIYVGGGKPSLQMKMESAVVTELRERGPVNRQGGTMEYLQRMNPNVARNVESQLESDTKDESDATMHSDAGGSTFSGIAKPQPNQLSDFMANVPERLGGSTTAANLSVAQLN